MNKMTLQYLVVFIILTVLGYFWFYQVKDSDVYATIILWAESNKVLLISIIIFIKILGIVWPPLPGGTIALATTPMLGWFVAYSADLFGGLVGGSINYIIAYKWGFPAIKKMFGEKAEESVKKVQIKRGREFESVIFFRLTLSGIAEIVNYAAGLFKINYFTFIAATTTAYLIVGVPLFYFSEQLLQQNSFWTMIGLLLFGFVLIIMLKDRYFETKK